MKGKMVLSIALAYFLIALLYGAGKMEIPTLIFYGLSYFSFLMSITNILLNMDMYISNKTNKLIINITRFLMKTGSLGMVISIPATVLTVWKNKGLPIDELNNDANTFALLSLAYVFLTMFYEENK